MKTRTRQTVRCILATFALTLGFQASAQGGGVTIIAHGFNSNVTDWIIPMAAAMSSRPTFPGTTYSCYEISITRNGSGQYVAAATFLGGTPPLVTDSGETLIKLDWSTISSFGGASSTQVATAAVGAVLSTNLIPEMGGRPLAELPLHLIGHSRGGSVVTEMARLLGAQGIWVDQVTTLDPRPVSSFGDAGVTTYANVLFADNFWQNMGDGLIIPNGQPVFGSYNRKLLDLNGGYSSTHSDVHLWYHGTIDLATPASDTQATIFSTQRATWWTGLETAGTTAGFLYSLIGGGDRLSNVEPAGVGNGRIIDGFNGFWELGGGLVSNRTALAANSGLWPNMIRATLGTTSIPAGEPIPLTLYSQSGAMATGEVDLRIFVDSDFNPYNGNDIEIDQRSLPNSGTSAVLASNPSFAADPAAVAPALYALGLRVSDGTHTRYLYASQPLEITPSLQAPRVDAASLVRDATTLRFHVLGFPGQTVTVFASTDLYTWTPLQTHTFSGTLWEFADKEAGNFSRRFYRAALAP